jgi:predicted negative regulator of RcsB-dependent stress response
LRREALVILIGVLVTVGILVGVGFMLANRQAQSNASEVLDLASNLAADGKWAEVIQTLTPLTDARMSSDQRDQVELLLAQANDGLGHRGAAATHWQQLADRARDVNLRGRAMFRLAMANLASGEDTAQIEGLIDRLTQLDAPEMSDRIGYLRARVLEARGNEVGARDALAAVWRAKPNSEIRDMIEEHLGKLNMDLLFSRQPHGSDIIHVIQRGDVLERLGRTYDVSPSLIERINHVDPRNLSIGRRIKIPRNAFRIEVYKDVFMLYLLDGDNFFARFPCRIGRVEYMTPEETFHIERKSVDPDWTDPATNRRYPAGDPGNELGTRWMGFGENPSLGIHGTIHPETIGTAASSGCIGLLRDDVELLFDLVPRGAEVRIFKTRAEADALRTRAAATQTPAPATPEAESTDAASK